MSDFDTLDFRELDLSDELVVFISGVPGVGKTTISYELLRKCVKFRLIQETDLIREILRGYNEFLNDFLLDDCNTPVRAIPNLIPDHMKIFDYDEMKNQCLVMRSPIEKNVLRQQRKHIPSIINGVHIVPEVLNKIATNKNIVFINLYINRKNVLRERLLKRDSQKYMPYLDVLFNANNCLFTSVEKLSQENPNVFLNIDVTNLNIDQVVEKTMDFIMMVKD